VTFGADRCEHRSDCPQKPSGRGRNRISRLRSSFNG
jgi:hypothetical protein